MSALPIDDVLAEFRDALAAGNRLVLAAPPGAGKTTRAPLAIMNEPWLAGKKILLLEPRRIAARMAADRMAGSVGEKTGGIIGLSTRVDRKVSAHTRIEVITDGLFTRRMLNDPELSGVGAVLFDEFHERSLNNDLGLALALDVQSGLRPDLRVVVMSATLDTANIARKLAAPVIESDGRIHPVATIYVGRSLDRIEDQTARAVRRALRDQEGSILVFMPGMGEILRTAERLIDLPDDVTIAPLYGALPPAEQDRAAAPALKGTRKVVLSTDIAESSLTIEGVDTVIDAGLARISEFDPGVGGSKLVTRRATRANVDQRRGRAGRTRPGVCYRLWDEEGTRGLAAAPTPEILSADLSGLVLALAEWGERDPSRLTWIDTPPAARIKAAQQELRSLGAIDQQGALTARGREMSAMPLPPRLAAMIAASQSPEDRALAAEIAALIGERGLGGDSLDLRERIERFRRDKSDRARALRDQARRWANRASPADLSRTGAIIATALPNSIARAKTGEHGKFLLAGGRAAEMDIGSPLSGEKWLAVAELTGASVSARILSAAPLREDDALQNAETAEIAEFDVDRRMFRARRVRRLGAIVLSETPLPAPSGDAAIRALLDALATHGFQLLNHGAVIKETQARLSIIRAHDGDQWPTLGDQELLERADEWLTPLLGSPPSLARPTDEQLQRALLSLIGWDAARKLNELAPTAIETPAGRAIKIDYLHEAGPMVEARVQEFFGIDRHPAIMRGNIPLCVSLLSPARRQIALTKNLPEFWAGGYVDMAKDMRGQYPKHDWPVDPSSANAHIGKTKARLKQDD